MSLLNVGARALMANQVALQTTGHNIANVSTAGYSRQSAQMVTVQGQFTGNGYVGQGVDVQTILRNHNELLTRQAAMAGSAQSSDVVRVQRLELAGLPPAVATLLQGAGAALLQKVLQDAVLYTLRPPERERLQRLGVQAPRITVEEKGLRVQLNPASA